MYINSNKFIVVSRSTVHGEHLPFAYPADQYKELTAKVDGYFEEEPVRKAMQSLRYSMSPAFRDAGCPVRFFPRTRAYAGGNTYVSAAENLRAAINQTQKAIGESGGYRGMMDTSYAHERLGLLLNGAGGEFRNDMSVLGACILERSICDAMHRIRIRYAVALELKEFRTTGNYTDDPDLLTKITHGVHLGFEQIGEDRLREGQRKRGYSHGASDADLEEIWGYGNPLPRELFDRMQGMDFRHRKLHEFGEQNRSKALSRVLPESQSIVWHTITTEVGGAGHIRGGERPSWFSSEPKKSTKHLGPVHPSGHSLNVCLLTRSPLEAQLKQTADQVAALLYDHPK